MTTYTFKPLSTASTVDWNNPAVWDGGVVPDSSDADVVFPETTVVASGSPYISTINVASEESETANSVAVTYNSLNIAGSLSVAGSLSLTTAGTLTMSGGTLDAGMLTNNASSVQGSGTIDAASLTNNGSLYGDDLSIDAKDLVNNGALDGTGTSIQANRFSNAGTLGAASVTVTPGGFTNLANGVLTGGTYDPEAGSSYGTVGSTLFNVGGVVTSDAATIILSSGSTLEFFDPTSQQYLPLQATLQTIAANGTLFVRPDSEAANGSTTPGTYTFGPLVDAGTIDVVGGTLAASQLTIETGGELESQPPSDESGGPVDATINASIVNNGTIVAGLLVISSGGYENGEMTLNGAISGNGTIEIPTGDYFDDGFYYDQSHGIATINAAVSAGQTVKFDDNFGRLTLDDASTFAGTIAPSSPPSSLPFDPFRSEPNPGDQIFLPNVLLSSITGVTYADQGDGGVLTLHQASGDISLNFSGVFDASSFVLSPGSQTLSSDPASVVITVGAPKTFAAGTSTVTSANSPAGEIYGLYETILGRAPDPFGLETYVGEINSGTSLPQIAQTLLTSAEYTSDFGPVGQSSDAAFITQIYQNGLDRAPDPGGLSTYEGLLASGSSRAEAAVDIATSPEIQGDLSSTFRNGVTVTNATDASIARLYYSLLDRTPDAAGLTDWSQAASSGSSLTQIAQSFLTSPEFQTTSAGQVVNGFVTNLYETALGRAPDTAGLQIWTSALETGQESDQQVADAFLTSSEFQNDYAGKSDTDYIEAVYQAALGRQADPGGLQTFQTALVNGLSRTQMADEFAGSQEFAANIAAPEQAAFVSALYDGAVGHAPDAGTLESYTTALSSGSSPAAVAVAIAESGDAQAHLAPRIEGTFIVT